MGTDEFPQSVEEAERHIRRIRADKGLGDGPDQIGNNASDLESALRILSEDLYQTATHFLLELIQNADDNAYKDDDPTLAITYTPGEVRIDCNEQGFSKKNVEAICRICQSTKSGRSKSTGFVGEKGIGFKAVFKVASQVWINSGHYSFRFDRDAHLGMIAPVWQDFPARKKPGWTSILLKLTPDCDQSAIVSELRSYDARVLLFLRRLRRLIVKVDTPALKAGVFLKSASFSTTLSRGEYPDTNPAMMTLKKDRTEELYLVWRHSAEDLPKEERRPGISNSQIVLAFPLMMNESEPLLRTQNVYAFLPIRDYGFKFLIQADLLLPATREDILQDSPWNKALMAATATAYVDAMKYMAQTNTKLRYTFIRFIPQISSQNPFFESFRKDLLEKLGETDLLESHAGTKRPAKELTRVPKEFCDYRGNPYLLYKDNGNEFLAGKYEEVDERYFAAMGMVTLPRPAFIDRLRVVMDDAGTGNYFINHKADDAWHAGFCKMLETFSHFDKSRIPVIPLRNGEWVEASAGNIYFAKHEFIEPVPEGIDIRVVDPVADKDPNRHRLYTSLGVKRYYDSDICDAIFTTHINDQAATRPEVLASHARFLFKAGWEKKVAPAEIWMACDQGVVRRSTAMYLPSTSPSTACKILPKGKGRRYGFLDPLYFPAELGNEGQENAWLNFLQNQLGVALYPRLVGYSATLELNPDPMHQDFRQITGQMLTEEALVILRDGLEYYQTYLDTSLNDGAGYYIRNARSRVAAHLGGMEVNCIGMLDSELLRDTFHADDKMRKIGDGLAPLLRIPEPENRAWRKLFTSLKVDWEDTLNFYLRCLRGASQTRFEDFARIQNLYLELQLKVASNVELVRNAFKNETLVFFPPTARKPKATWRTTTDCIWRGESWLSCSYALERHYPENEILFRNQLLIPNSELKSIIREAQLIRPGRSTKYITRIFSAFATHLTQSNFTIGEVEDLKQLKMFPIVTKPESEPYEYLSSVNDTKPWLIADRSAFWTHFQYVLPVLGLTVEAVLKVRPFLEAMEVGDRLLSKIATSVTEAHGDKTPSEELTRRYRSRIDYVLRLIPEDHRREVNLDNLRQVNIYLASSVVQYWRAPLGLRQVQSTLTEGKAFLEADYAGNFSIYLVEGYDSEPNPSELAEQLRSHCNIPAENRDLLNVVLAARPDRINELFDSRGIPPLKLDLGSSKKDQVGDEEIDDDAADSEYDPAETRAPDPQTVSTSRIARLLRQTKPTPPTNGQTDPENTQLGGISKPGAVQASPTPANVATIKSTLRELEFVDQQGQIVGTQSTPLTFKERFKDMFQGDWRIGEMVVSDVLETALGNQYDPYMMHNPGKVKPENRSAFNFVDKQGRFTALLARLNGVHMRQQGHGNLIYHIDVKATNKAMSQDFTLSPDELERARRYSVLNTTEDHESGPYEHIPVLAYVSEVRTNPSISFLVDPWEKLSEGEIRLGSASKMRASLHMKTRPMGVKGEFEGLDVVQKKQLT